MSDARQPLAIWGGVECTLNRVGDRWFDRLAWSGHDERIAARDKFAPLGIRTLRYPVLRERVAPQRLADSDWRWADQRLDRLHRHPAIVGLRHHGSGPWHASFRDESFPEKLAPFARGRGRFLRRLEDALHPFLHDLQAHEGSRQCASP